MRDQSPFPVPKIKRIENPKLIAMLKLQVRKCEWCGVEKWNTIWPLDPHHIKTRGAGGDDSLQNLVILCRTCHDIFQFQGYKIHRAVLIAIAGKRASDPYWLAIEQRGVERCRS